jgi:hypothetical protein
MPEVGEAFPRPSSRFNGAVAALVGLLPRRPLTVEGLEPFQQRSAQTLVAMGAQPAAVAEVTGTTRWIMRPGPAPRDAWGGEVLRGDPPIVALYRDCLLARVPGRRLYRVAAQLMVDHMYGHLYEYYSGSEDWGEEVACRWQYRLLRHRGGPANRLTAEVVALTHRFHKRVEVGSRA